MAPSVKAYQETIIDGALQEFLQKSQDAAGVVGEHVSPRSGSPLQTLTPDHHSGRTDCQAL